MIKEWVDRLRIALGDRRYAYQKTFSGPLADTVLFDLARFCRAHHSTFHSNELVHAKLDGRREVWLRIQEHLKLTPEQLWDLYSRIPTDTE